MSVIRPARADDLPFLPAIETEADLIYAGVGLDLVMAMQPASQARLAQGPLWVAADPDDRPVGFALAGTIAPWAFLDQLSVLPGHGRQGLGTALLETVAAWAKTQGFPALILTTYREPPWNAPFYAKHGFSELTQAHWSAALIALVARETALGHPLERRCVMIRPLIERSGGGR